MVEIVYKFIFKTYLFSLPNMVIFQRRIIEKVKLFPIFVTEEVNHSKLKARNILAWLRNLYIGIICTFFVFQEKFEIRYF